MEVPLANRWEGKVTRNAGGELSLGIIGPRPFYAKNAKQISIERTFYNVTIQYMKNPMPTSHQH